MRRLNVLPRSEPYSGATVLLVTNVPNPYRVPLFNEIHDQLRARDMNFRVVFGAQGYPRRLWQLDMTHCRFEYNVLASRAMALGGNVEHTMFSYSGLRTQLHVFNPDVIIVTGFSLAAMQVWRYSRRHATPYIIWTGSILSRSWIRELQRRMLVRGASSFVAYGTRAMDYLVGLGATADRISIGINTVDTQFFHDATSAQRKLAPAATSIPQRFLYVGYLSQRKRVDRIVDAAAVLASRRSDFVIDIIGDGDALPRVKAYAAERGLNDRLVFHGYKQRHELPEYFARAVCLLLSSEYELWGLVLIEAMAAGLPVIASANAGATTDVIVEGRTGFAVDFAETAAVARAMEWILDHPVAAAEMGQRAQRFVSQVASIEKSAAGFIAAIDLALGDKNAVAAQ